MSQNHRSTGTERQDAIARARRAAGRLAAVPSTAEPVARLMAIIENTRVFTAWEAWDGVVALESMVVDHGLVTPEQIEAERAEQAATVLADMEAYRAELFGATGEERV